MDLLRKGVVEARQHDYNLSLLSRERVRGATKKRAPGIHRMDHCPG